SSSHFFSFLNPTPPTHLYPLSLHDALPISPRAFLPSASIIGGAVAIAGGAFFGTACSVLSVRISMARGMTPAQAYASLATNRFRSEEHTSELQSRSDLVCRLLLEKKKNKCK